MQAVILAAGASSRFWPLNTRHKSLLRVQGKTLLRHTLDSLAAHGVDDAVVVQGPDREVEQELDVPDGMDVTFAVQQEARGMGNALEQAREHLAGRFLVTGPYRFDAGGLLANMEGVTGGHAGAVIATETSSPERYGVLRLDGDTATGIIEKPDPDEAPSDYRVVSTYLLEDSFFDYLDEVEEHEYSFEDALDIYMQENDVAVATVEEAPASLKYPWDALDIAAELLEGQERHVSDTADVADSATINGAVVIGDDVTVHENAVINGPCYIGPGCTIGTNALVRDHTTIEQDSVVGTNAEIRGSVIQANFSMHSGFIGDSVIGRDVAVGAGAVTANRRVRDASGGRPDIAVHVRSEDEEMDTGRNRLGIMAGDSVDIGTQANLMPGVCIGPRTFIGPSAMVRSNVGADKRYFTKIEGTELER